MELVIETLTIAWFLPIRLVFYSTSKHNLILEYGKDYLFYYYLYISLANFLISQIRYKHLLRMQLPCNVQWNFKRGDFDKITYIYHAPIVPEDAMSIGVRLISIDTWWSVGRSLDLSQELSPYLTFVLQGYIRIDTVEFT